MRPLVVGLGNPGRRYMGTRHNLGYAVVEHLAGKTKFSKNRSGCEVAEIPGMLLVKTGSYMNLSGPPLKSLLTLLGFAVRGFPRELSQQLLVVHDELDLPFGEIRVKLGGGHAGHNGLRSISAALGPDYRRVRIGIGRPDPEVYGQIPVADWVLSRFSTAESKQTPGIVVAAAEKIVTAMKPI